MSAPPSRRGPGRVLAHLLDGGADRLPPAWAVGLLPLLGLGLLLLAGLGWVGMVLVLAVCGAAVVLLVRAASWSDLPPPGTHPPGASAGVVAPADGEEHGRP